MSSFLGAVFCGLCLARCSVTTVDFSLMSNKHLFIYREIAFDRSIKSALVS